MSFFGFDTTLPAKTKSKKTKELPLTGDDLDRMLEEQYLKEIDMKLEEDDGDLDTFNVNPADLGKLFYVSI